MQEPKKKTRWWVWLLLVFGVLTILGIAVIGGIVWWFSANKDRLIAEGKSANEEAATFAASHDQSACVDEGLRKVMPCDGIMCEATTKVFTEHCITQATPTPGFCDGVPAMGEIMNTSRWVVAECQRRGKPNNQRCQRLVQAVPEACHRKHMP
jgi:hypothetical protein